MTATLTFPSSDSAKQFARDWAFLTAKGHDMSALRADGSRAVTVYDVTPEQQAWIERYVSRSSMTTSQA